MINRFILLIIIAFATGIDFLQAQQVLATAGHYHANAQGSLSYTIGEPFVSTLSTTDNILTQGFQQSKLLLTVITEKQAFAELIRIYPNPAGSTIHVELNSQNPLNLIVELYSVQGFYIFSTQTQKTLTEISTENFKPGAYLLRIIHEGQAVKTVKVVKR